jgi:2-oxoisovalerate dehydrogenase E2 component (dihydrolipoyl transacylase)
MKWHVALGDDIREEQPLVDIMTDKATVEIVSPVSGRVVSRNGEEGSKLAVGSEFVVFEIEGGEAASEPEVSRPKAVAATSKSASPAASGKMLASPAVRERAKAMGVDLATVTGTGPGGRILHGDLDRMLAQGRGRAASPVSTEVEAGATRISGLRRRIAERMEVANRIPHFSYVEEVDVTALEALRAELNSMKGASSRLTVLPFIIGALTKCLADHPGVNAHFTSEQGVVHRFTEAHMGIATQTDRGLLVPVIRNAERKDLWQLAAEIAHLSEAARSGKATLDELSGSTITVTSLGALGGIAATPIINAPEVAIIGVNRIAERPMVQEGAIVIAKMMNLSSSFDHRIVDGYEAAAFIKAVKDRLEAPTSLVTTVAN